MNHAENYGLKMIAVVYKIIARYVYLCKKSD